MEIKYRSLAGNLIQLDSAIVVVAPEAAVGRIQVKDGLRTIANMDLEGPWTQYVEDPEREYQRVSSSIGRHHSTLHANGHDLRLAGITRKSLKKREQRLEKVIGDSGARADAFRAEHKGVIRLLKSAPVGVNPRERENVREWFYEVGDAVGIPPERVAKRGALLDAYTLRSDGWMEYLDHKRPPLVLLTANREDIILHEAAVYQDELSIMKPTINLSTFNYLYHQAIRIVETGNT